MCNMRKTSPKFIVRVVYKSDVMKKKNNFKREVSLQIFTKIKIKRKYILTI